MAGPTSYFDPSHVDELDAHTADLVRPRTPPHGPPNPLI
jgi:hypothetical protein